MGKAQASFHIPGGSVDQFTHVEAVLRAGLAVSDSQTARSQAITAAFREAVRLWPSTNHSDLWYFLIRSLYVTQPTPDDFDAKARVYTCLRK